MAMARDCSLGLWLLASLVVLSVGLWGPTPLAAQCAVSKTGAACLDLPREAFELRVADGLQREIVERAIALWSACPQYAASLPASVETAGPGRTLIVRIEQESRSRTCGRFDGEQIVLYRRARNDYGMAVSCDLALNLAHELGHALGLRDSPRLDRCRSSLMWPGTQRRLGRRRVQADECAALAAYRSPSTELAQVEGRGAQQDDNDRPAGTKNVVTHWAASRID